MPLKLVAARAALALPLLLASALPATASPLTPQNSAWNVNTNSASEPASYCGGWSGHAYFPSPDDWRKVPVYQFITDRFCDGEPANNELAYPGYDLRDVGSRHGGDFLGYKAIWVSPVFQNRANSYHGYGQIDFTLLDQRFGTVEDFRAMVDKAHSLGLYVIVDIVVNHLENLYYFEGHPNDGAPFRLHTGEYQLFPRNPGETYVDFPVDNTFYSTGTYCDVFGDDGTNCVDSGSGSFWFSDLHHNGDLGNYGDPWQNHLGKIYGSLDDLRTTHPRVQDKIIAMTKALISTCDIDGIRMDTPMQVPRYFFECWCPAVKTHAAALGKNDFFIFGEFYCSRERAATMVGRGKSPNQYGDPYAFIDGDYTMAGGINYRANSITDGIHVLEVTTNALSPAGLNLYGKFRSRFLIGDDANILVNRNATNDLALVNNGAPVVTSTNVTLYHKAVGAQKYRARNETSAWSPWQTLATTTGWTLSPGNGSKTVEVQYWADGSAAYFVTGPATLQQETYAANGVPISWLQYYGFTGDYDAAALGDQDNDGPLTWQEYYAGTIPTNSASVWRVSAATSPGANVVTWPSISNRLYAVTWSTNVLGPWTLLATNRAATPPQNSYSDTSHAAEAHSYYRVSVRNP
jgi:hypothetical protein